MFEFFFMEFSGSMWSLSFPPAVFSAFSSGDDISGGNLA